MPVKKFSPRMLSAKWPATENLLAATPYKRNVTILRMICTTPINQRAEPLFDTVHGTVSNTSGLVMRFF
jgi:hypothetical protein